MRVFHLGMVLDHNALNRGVAAYIITPQSMASDCSRLGGLPGRTSGPARLGNGFHTELERTSGTRHNAF